MTKRLTAALAAFTLTFAALVVVSTSAGAHDQTVQRCAFDPFAGQQCWDEPVTHTHRVIPDNPPPDTSPRPCPTGTTGTPPDCQPVPSDNTNHVPDDGNGDTTTTCPDGTTGTPPDCSPVQTDNSNQDPNPDPDDDDDTDDSDSTPSDPVTSDDLDDAADEAFRTGDFSCLIELLDRLKCQQDESKC